MEFLDTILHGDCKEIVKQLLDDSKIVAASVIMYPV